MSSCPQCHADFSAEELDLENPVCPVCGEPFGGKESLGEENNETEEHDPLKNAPKIDGFEIIRHIGRGGMGDVWEAKQNVLGRKVAIKVLAKNLSHSEHFLARFTREAYTLGRLQHPGIVSIHDFRSSPDGLCCIIMEFVEGPKRGESITLFDLLLRKELTPERIRFLILEILQALQYAHEEGVIHRDIKPTNVLIDRYGRVKVVDFGIAAMPSDPNRKQLTYVGGPLGTAEYMAPEQTEDATQADHRADLYAVGVVLYELLTGTRPRGLFAMPSKVKSGIDPAWDSVVSKALQSDREQRFANASDMIATIQSIGTSHPDSSVTPSSTPVSELRFDKEPDQFPGTSTPLPIHTPTADSPIKPDDPGLGGRTPKKPGDTDLLPEEEEENGDVPAWMLKRRDELESLGDTQANLDVGGEGLEDQSEHIFEPPQTGPLDSALHLDRQLKEEPADTPDEVPLAEASDLDDWLSTSPAPKGHDSSNLIEVSARLAPANEVPANLAPTADEESAPVEKTSETVGEEESQKSKEVPKPHRGTPTGSSGILTTEESAKADSAPPLPPRSQGELPEGDFVELCYDAHTSPKTKGDKAILFCPAIRPPTLKICVLDDGSSRKGEWFRVRQSRFIIGRKEGDLRIAHDRNISSRHAEISLEKTREGIAEFVLRDLDTTNGTFARASRAVLEDGQEFLLGGRRYKLVCANPNDPQRPACDTLMEVSFNGRGKIFTLDRMPIVIGRDPQRCDVLVLDDPFLSPTHAILKRDDRNRWVIKNYNSRNGIWIQIDEMRIVSGGEFQIGNQRLIVQLP